MRLSNRGLSKLAVAALIILFVSIGITVCTVMAAMLTIVIGQ